MTESIFDGASRAGDVIAPAHGARAPAWRRAAAAGLCTAVLVLAGGAPAAAQSVGGRLLEQDTNAPIPGGRLMLRDSTGSVIRQDTTDTAGAFMLRLAAPGTYTLEAVHPAYAAMPPVRVDVEREELVSVDVRMSRSAVPLDPLTVTARRLDPRQELSFEGALARRADFPDYGSRRVLLSTDPELRSSSQVGQALTFMPPTRSCLIVYWNGTVVQSRQWVDLWLEHPAVEVEAVEFYRNYHDAPAAMRIPPTYVTSPSSCSVIALWPEQNPRPHAHALLRAAIAGAVLGFLALIGSLVL